MKLTTKRNRWFFCRELFSYLIPMILIVGTIDVFRGFMICPLHPEWSAPARDTPFCASSRVRKGSAAPVPTTTNSDTDGCAPESHAHPQR